MIRKAALVVGAALAATSLTACTGSDGGTHYKPVSAPRVQLSIGKRATGTVTVGVVYTTQDGFVGSSDADLASGAIVAAQRIDAGSGLRIKLDPVNDGGTSAGASAAIQKFVADKVSAVVYASQGSQVSKGVAAAKAAGLPVLLPYDPGLDVSLTQGDRAWFTGPTADQTIGAMVDELHARGLRRPILISDGSAPGYTASLGLVSAPLRVTATGTTLSQAVAAGTKTVGKNGGPDSVIVWGSAVNEAGIVGALQQANVTEPVLLGPDALSPKFGLALEQQSTAGGFATPSGNFETFGEPATDFTRTSSMQAFLAALRAVAADTSVTGLDGTDTFATDGAEAADVRSHDSVVAIARAVAKAGSTSPAAVASALQTLRLGSGDGLAGADLDFTAPSTVARSSVVGLQAGTQSSGERSAFADPNPVSWYASANS